MQLSHLLPLVAFIVSRRSPKLETNQHINMLKRVIGIIVLTFALVALASCSSRMQTNFSRTAADWQNRPAQVQCYSGGKEIYNGRTEGKVISETDSDGYAFIAADDKKLKEVSGDCVITYF